MNAKGWLIGLVAAAALASSAVAGTWNDNFGIGNASDEWGFSGQGVVRPVTANVLSNCVYYITSAKSSGQPRIKQVFAKSDLAAGTLNYYVATDTYTITNSAIAGTNVLALNRTNNLVAKDLLVVRSLATDCYQLMVASNATFICVTYDGLTNAVAAGDIAYRMTPVQSFTPFSMHAITNQVILPAADYVPFAIGGSFFEFEGRLGMPSMLIQTHLAAGGGGLAVRGEYYVRPRR